MANCTDCGKKEGLFDTFSYIGSAAYCTGCYPKAKKRHQEAMEQSGRIERITALWSNRRNEARAQIERNRQQAQLQLQEYEKAMYRDVVYDSELLNGFESRFLVYPYKCVVYNENDGITTDKDGNHYNTWVNSNREPVRTIYYTECVNFFVGSYSSDSNKAKTDIGHLVLETSAHGTTRWNRLRFSEWTDDVNEVYTYIRMRMDEIKSAK